MSSEYKMLLKSWKASLTKSKAAEAAAAAGTTTMTSSNSVGMSCYRLKASITIQNSES